MDHCLEWKHPGSFRVMQLTDTHYTGIKDMDARTDALLRALIRLEQPDFIMHTGDCVYGDDNVSQLSKALAPLMDSGIPWSLVFGNHDAECGEGKDALFARLQTLPGCMIWHDEASGEGLGNCYFPVVNQDHTPLWLLMCLDSGQMMDPSIGGYAAVSPAQIRWHESVIREHARIAAHVSGITFLHIPLPEYEDVYLHARCYGMKREEVCCARINTGLFASMQRDGHTRAVFAGHDHVNDYHGTLLGITLGYGRQSGYGSYGAEDELRGCRMIELGPDGTMNTYIRLENGMKIEHPWVHEPRDRWETC